MQGQMWPDQLQNIIHDTDHLYGFASTGLRAQLKLVQNISQQVLRLRNNVSRVIQKTIFFFNFDKLSAFFCVVAVLGPAWRSCIAANVTKSVPGSHARLRLSIVLCFHWRLRAAKNSPKYLTMSCTTPTVYKALVPLVFARSQNKFKTSHNRF